VKNKTNPGEGIDQAAGGTLILLPTTQNPKTDHLPEDILPQSTTILPPTTLPRKTADPRLVNITLLLRITTILPTTLLLLAITLPTLPEREDTLNPHDPILHPMVARIIAKIITPVRRILRENMNLAEIEELLAEVMNIPEEGDILLKNKSIHIRPDITNPAEVAAEEDTRNTLKNRITKTMIMQRRRQSTKRRSLS